MFTIYGDRKSFYQWDSNQKLIVNSPICSEVHFSNVLSTEALVCVAYKLDELTVVDVPNILLTEALDIKAYIVAEDGQGCRTCNTGTFEVIKRDKPADYIYTETELKDYAEYEERLAALEAYKHIGQATEDLGEIFNIYDGEDKNQAKGYASHAEGRKTTASGANSHAEGHSTTASGANSHAEGNSTIARGDYQHVQGKYNVEDTENNYAHIVGNGTSENKRSNAYTLDWHGNSWQGGSVEAAAIILTSPNGTRYKITVNDDGTLTTTAA